MRDAMTPAGECAQPSGMWMQGLTTTEPDDSMIEVAIAAVETVFDWRAYLMRIFRDGRKEDYDGGNGNDESSEMIKSAEMVKAMTVKEQ